MTPNKAQGTGGEKTKCPFCDGRGWVCTLGSSRTCECCDGKGALGTFTVTPEVDAFLNDFEKCTCGFFTTTKMPRADGKPHEHAPTCPLR